MPSSRLARRLARRSTAGGVRDPAGGRELLPQELRASLLRNLPEYMDFPSAFVVQASFPLTPNRKMDRRSLPLPSMHNFPSAPCASPGTDAEKRIAAIWKELLRRNGVGIHDNFFDLGGHSLLLVRLQSRLRHQFGREIPMLELFQKPTIAAMAGFFTSPSTGAVRFHAECDRVQSGTTYA